MRREWRNGRWEVLVDTPVGPQWQEDTASRPALPDSPYARYDPAGRQAGVPTSYYQRPTSEEEDLFGPEFGSVMGDALKGNQGLVGGGGGHGGGNRPYDIASMTAGMSKYPSLYLRKQRYP